jgi:hypothetical protein
MFSVVGNHMKHVLLRYAINVLLSITVLITLTYLLAFHHVISKYYLRHTTVLKTVLLGANY